MKKDIHPEFREVLFRDVTTDFSFVCRSTVQTNATEEFEGTEYPLVKLNISSASHPFYTGNQRNADLEGRIDKFRRRYAK